MSNQPTTELQKFAGDMFWVAAAGLAGPLIGLVTLPAMTRNYTAEIYAVWVQSFLVVGLLSFILNLCLGNTVVRFLASEDNIEKRRLVLGVILWPVIVIDCVALIISLVFAGYLSKILFATNAYDYLVPLIFLWAAVQAIYSLLFNYLLARRRIKRYSVIQIMLAIYQMLVIVVLAMSHNDLAWIIGSIVAGVIIVLVVVLVMVVKEVGWPEPSVEGLKGYLAFSIPLIPSGILFWAISSSDRFFITNLLNLGQAGIYAASFSIGNLIYLIYSPIPVVLLPVLSRLWEQKEMSKVSSYLEYSNRFFITLAIPGVAGLYILSQPLLAIFTTSDYTVGGGLVLLIALATTLSGLYQINVPIILLAKQTKWLVPVVAFAAIANIGINLVIIPLLGIFGAAAAAIASYLILAVTVMVWARKSIKYSIGVRFITKVTIGALLMAYCINLINIGGVPGIVIAAIAGLIIFGLWMWLTRAFSREDIKLIKEITLGLRQGTLIR